MKLVELQAQSNETRSIRCWSPAGLTILSVMAFDGDCHAMAQRALELENSAPLVEHDPAECEMCAEYQKEFYSFAREALPRLAEAYLDITKRSVEAFENAKMRGRFLEDLQEENKRLEKELAAREAEIEELQNPQERKRGFLR